MSKPQIKPEYHPEYHKEGRYRIHGFFPVLAALIGNLLVAVIKFFAFLVSGSLSLFSESIHSLADTFNELLLMVGIKRSLRKPDSDYAYGYGRERFFWALISACGIFFLGAGVVIYHGFESLFRHQKMLHNPIVYWILGISLVLESATFLLAVREIRRNHPNQKFTSLLKTADPSTLAVLYEDGLAIIGIIVASASIFLTEISGAYYWDSLGSIVIGFFLALIAIVLISKNREFLLGKKIPADLQDKIIRTLEADPAIERVIDFKSSTLDIGVYRIKCEIEFNGNALLRQVFQQSSLHEEFLEVKDDFEKFKKFCVDYADRVPRLVGRKIDEIEQKLKTENQGVKYIDIEIN